MNRKLWLESRPLFVGALCLSFGLTLLYTGLFGASLIFVQDDASGFAIQIGTYDASSLVKDYPQGTLYSLKYAPQNYYEGFDAMTRILWPGIALLLCVGGILTERSGGTASFNLSLPVSRAGWLCHKAAMVSFLTFAAAFLTGLLALLFGLWMGLDWSLVWLLTHPVLITLPALPWIGVSLYAQSWTPRFITDPAGAMIVPFLLVGIGMAEFIALGLLSPVAGSWGIAMAALAIGAGCMFLATRRFERLDF
jgi:hypothetical protein